MSCVKAENGDNSGNAMVGIGGFEFLGDVDGGPGGGVDIGVRGDGQDGD